MSALKCTCSDIMHASCDIDGPTDYTTLMLIAALGYLLWQRLLDDDDDDTDDDDKPPIEMYN